MPDPNPDVIASAPRPTPHHGAVPVMSTVCVHGLDFGEPCLPCREYIRGIEECRQEAEIPAPRPTRTMSPRAIAAIRARAGTGSAGAMYSDLVALLDHAEATAPPTIPADLRALLEALVAARDEQPYDVRRCATADVVEDLIAWTRAHAGGGR